MNKNKSLADLSIRLDSLSNHSEGNNGNGGSSSNNNSYWKGKKVIPLSEWKKIANTNYAFGHGVEHQRTSEAMQYFPDDYSQYLFPLDVQDNMREEAERWLNEYLELVEHKRNASYGKSMCSGCLLNPEYDKEPILLGSNRIVAKGLVIADVEERKREDGKTEDVTTQMTEEADANTSTKAATEPNKKMRARLVPYPCTVPNRFECPYEKDKVKIGENANFDVDSLFYLQENVVIPTELAFSRMISISENNELVYEADFVNGKVNELRYYPYGDPYYSSTEYELEEGLSKVKRLVKVRITNAKEMYNALTDERQLALVLDEGLDPEYLQYKDQMIEYFTSIRDRINIEDLRVLHEVGSANRIKNECDICKSFANIHCVNCQEADKSAWLCVDHWRDHSSKHHSIS